MEKSDKTARLSISFLKIKPSSNKIDVATKEKVESKSKALKEATDNEDYDAMKKLLEELQQELYAVGSSVYQQPGNPSAASGASEQTPPKDDGDDVIDADFTESK